MSDEAVRVDLTTAILALNRTTQRQTEVNSSLVGLMKDQITLMQEQIAESKLLRSEVASLSNEMAILRRDVELVRDGQSERRPARDANGQ